MNLTEFSEEELQAELDRRKNQQLQSASESEIETELTKRTIENTLVIDRKTGKREVGYSVN